LIYGSVGFWVHDFCRAAGIAEKVSRVANWPGADVDEGASLARIPFPIR